MKTIQQIEVQMFNEHKRGLDLFAKNDFERVTICSMLVSAYLNGQADATRELLECKTAPTSH